MQVQLSFGKRFDEGEIGHTPISPQRQRGTEQNRVIG
jgi:hypothetical protein